MAFVLRQSQINGNCRLQELAECTHDYDELPVDLGKGCAVLEDHLVARTDDRELLGWPAILYVPHHLGGADFVALIRSAVVHYDGDGGGPVVKLVHPVRERAQGSNNKMRSKVVLLLAE